MLPDFIQQMYRAATVRVAAPTDVIFLCGGKIPRSKKVRIASLRDAFLRIENNPALEDRVVRLAEEVNTFQYEREAYKDLLKFELEFAQICNLVLLFSESEGSIAEMGAFSMIKDIAARILVLVRDIHLVDPSFIRFGPLLRLTNTQGRHAVFVLNDDELNLRKSVIKDVDLDVLRDRIGPAVATRMGEVESHSTFNKKLVGHRIKLLVGLVQEFGALTAIELKRLADEFGFKVSAKRIDSLMLCAEAALWVVREKRGFSVFYVAKPTKRSALTVKLNDGELSPNRVRRRLQILEFWEATDDQRFRAIQKHAGDAE